MSRRVLITGLGAVSPLGSGVARFWQGLLVGGARPVPLPDPRAHMRSPLMYLVPGDAVPVAPAHHGHVPLGPGPRMAVAAAREAVADAALGPQFCSAMPVVMGVEMGNAAMHEARRAAGTPADPDGPWNPLTVTASAAATAVRARGSNVSVGNACAASGYAVSVAADMIREGEAEIVLAGGAEGPTRVGLGVFNRLGAADPEACRPFDRHRKGTVFGDGSAMLVLESAEHADRRGAVPYAELAGFAWSCDAHHLTAPEPSAVQAVRAIRDALTDAGTDADRIGGVIPHGTGTPLNDAVESYALREVFGERCDRLPLLNLKAMIGHTAGAAGAFGCLAAALLIRHRSMPASPALQDPDPECPVWIPQDHPVPLAPASVLVNAYAFGGTNVSLVVTEAQEAA
ncbi:beta-ketoacyl-[acyl-carrier-protein] synthase family protein [Streptomyces sp. RB6PN25]|uniref:Beta-ketoacyl-[acyl-carrier-protein] synthase family protein n=1 Tax=Streptomyces humicola TaxID=2953240 RepID=A0ABT1PTB9_9ACTN|nr:beta-ketoacyl-[acyl-carrier-protein] synthase family protein [Streptomyces humicola]MCQ4080919.1 beta-ketoacyl-[acyl-carrier-protein] synthase family protein [Streptomyces humicola]